MLLQNHGNFLINSLTWVGCKSVRPWRCETRRPQCATQSSNVANLNVRAHCLALQMIVFMSPTHGSDAFCKVLRKQIVTQLNCGNHTSCKEPISTARESESPRCFVLVVKKASRENHLYIYIYFFLGVKKNIWKASPKSIFRGWFFLDAFFHHQKMHLGDFP